MSDDLDLGPFDSRPLWVRALETRQTTRVRGQGRRLHSKMAVGEAWGPWTVIALIRLPTTGKYTREGARIRCECGAEEEREVRNIRNSSAKCIHGSPQHLTRVAVLKNGASRHARTRRST